MEITGESLGGVIKFLLKWGPYFCAFFFLFSLVEAICAYRAGNKVIFYTGILIAASFGGTVLIFFIRKYFGPGPTIFGIPLF
ncbi:MAG: hypothetical protein C4570_00825 [Ammonifex sp.]|jgi:hypothetical protein|nr:MAG: hypothetical protein C4570_00825 [Ammonifex sp.]